ncbi:MAG: FtsX-like permease family protein [Eubacteriales bacterium]|nr:FtsX-like permease family protein [Eubacteriales bacterium]
MNFIAKANFRAHYRQYTATAIALIICTAFMAVASCFASTIPFLLNGNRSYQLNQSDIIITSSYSINFDAKDELPANRKAYAARIADLVGNEPGITPDMQACIKADLAGDYEKRYDLDRKLTEKQIDQVDEIIQRYSRAGMALESDASTLLEACPSLSDIQLSYRRGLAVSTGKRNFVVTASRLLAEPHINPDCVEGRLPEAENEAIISAALAKSENIQINDELQIRDQYKKADYRIKVVGYNREDLGQRLGFSSNFYLSKDSKFFSEQNIDPDSLLIKLKPGASLERGLSEIRQAFENKIAVNTTLYALSREAYLKADQGNRTAVLLVLDSLVYLFPLIASLVCLSIVSSTFTVVLARRRREQALLRCIGASAKQLRRSALAECSMIGFIASVIGAIIGYALVLGISVFTGVLSSVKAALLLFSYSPILIPVVVGFLITVIAGRTPSRQMSKIPPVAALNPRTFDEIKPKQRRLARIIFASIFSLIAAVGFYIVTVWHASDFDMDKANAFVLYTLSVLLTLIVIVFVGRFLLPRFAALLLKPFVPGSASARLAATNIARDRQRYGATMTTLLIGLVMIGTITIGTYSLDTTLTNAFGRRYPIDMTMVEYDNGAFAKEKLDEVMSQKPYVEESILIESFKANPLIKSGSEEIELNTNTYSDPENPEKTPYYVIGFSGALSQVSRDKDLEEVPDGEIWVDPLHGGVELDQFFGKEVSFSFPGTDYRLTGKLMAKPLKFLSFGWGQNRFMVSQNEVQKLQAAQVETRPCGILARMKMANSLQENVKSFIDIQSSPGEDISTSGNFVVLMVFRLVLHAIMMILLVLIGICTMVAVIGVANTLSLSVLERRHEHALLRAVGCSRKQLRNILLIEGLMIGIVALVLGLILSIVFANYGLRVLPLNSIVETGDYQVRIPLYFILSISFGTFILTYLASLIPSRYAAAASPVEALASSEE